ncbi:hypothetical protein M0813_01374 [Anaeramoeba flamelloides]|uniref:BTB domain-containing protein n=1 Tax=Anaeramoeba flamelloides TaxID=1746091 RepID=A0ABQ8Z8W9_9EUKA|nr:hypothetical protein M0813_01374 [Anaeramoeba flamelloides]
MTSDIYYSGRREHNFLVKDPRYFSKLPLWTPVNKVSNVKKIVSTKNDQVLFLKADGKIEVHEKNKEIRRYELKNEKIIDIQASHSFLILTKSGKVYLLAYRDSRRYYGTNVEDPKKNEEQLIPLTFFINNGLFVESFQIATSNAFFLCKGGKLYGHGLIDNGRLGIKREEHYQKTPILILENVKRVFSWHGSMSFFVITTDDELFVSGYNYDGGLGLGRFRGHAHTPEKLTNLPFQVTDILDFKAALISVLITKKEGRTFSCGRGDYNGHNKKLGVFTEIEMLKNHKAIQLESGVAFGLVLTSENRLFGWGFSRPTRPTNQFKSPYIPQEYDIPSHLVRIKSLKIACCPTLTFVYKPAVLLGSLKLDLKQFLKRQKFADLDLKLSDGQIIKVHKILIELRTGLKINEFQNLINQNHLSKKDLNVFLKWVYYNQLKNNTVHEKIIHKIFNLLKISLDPNSDQFENSLENDLIKLYKDDDSKDFKILLINKNKEVDVVKEQEGAEEKEDNEDEEGEDGLLVHKSILLARSGLFRDMFDNLNLNEKNINQIKDYSNKSIESLEILIKYFYTNKIQLTADEDPELIVEELEDAVEYYQLNENCNFNEELQKIKK